MMSEVHPACNKYCLVTQIFTEFGDDLQLTLFRMALYLADERLDGQRRAGLLAFGTGSVDVGITYFV